MWVKYTSGYSASHVTLLYASVKYIFTCISKIRSIGYFLVECTSLLLDLMNLLCILNAFVHKCLVQLRTVSVAWLIGNISVVISVSSVG